MSIRVIALMQIQPLFSIDEHPPYPGKEKLHHPQPYVSYRPYLEVKRTSTSSALRGEEVVPLAVILAMIVSQV